MTNINHLSVGHQIILIFGLICALLVAIGLLLFFSLGNIERSIPQQQASVLSESTLIEDLAQDVGRMQADVLREAQASDPEVIRNLDQAVRDIERTDAKGFIDYQKRFIYSKEERQLYDRVMQARAAYWEQTQSLMVLAQSNRDAEAEKLVNSTQAPAYDGYLKAISALTQYVENKAGETSEETTHSISKIRVIGDTLAGFALLFATATGLAIAKIGHRLKENNLVLQTEVGERKQAEENLRGKTAMLEAQVNSSIDGILVVDGKRRRILQNKRMAELWKIPQPIVEDEDYQKQLDWITGTTTNPQQFAEKVAYLYSHPHEISRDEIELKDGTILDRYSSPVVGKNGEYYGRIWSFRDITERKRVETRMFQSQKMETVGKLAGGVAHEFNSILTAIIGQSEFLLNELPLEGPQAKSAHEIRQAADRAAVLTRQLLAYGRKQILQPEILDLNQILTVMVSTLQHLMGREVDVRIVPALGLKTVKIDPGQMEQVIVNIAMNAADAMPNGGRFTLETSNVTLDEEYVHAFPGLKAGGYVMLSMTDTGIGMSAEVKARAFEPFFSTKGVGQGTGLGLSTCYGILKQSDGHINVYSEVARGSTFKVYLPQVEPQTITPLPRLISPDLPRGTETILLAEDDPSLLEMSATLLRRLGYTVLTAVNGIEALSLKNQRDIGHIDLLFTDVVMPHMSGKELSDRIRAIYPRTKILFTSAYTENAIVHQGMLNEGITLLQKPFTPSALANKVREVLDRPSPP